VHRHNLLQVALLCSIQLSGIDTLDYYLFTCCICHRSLLENRFDGLFLHLTCSANAHLRIVNSAFRYCVTHKNSLIASDFEYILVFLLLANKIKNQFNSSLLTPHSSLLERVSYA